MKDHPNVWAAVRPQDHAARVAALRPVLRQDFS